MTAERGNADARALLLSVAAEDARTESQAGLTFLACASTVVGSSSKALRWLRLTADRGSPIDWLPLLRNDAEKGDMQSAFELGRMFIHGNRTVTADRSQALRWLGLAAHRGHTEAAQLSSWLLGSR